jgi:hypothetical protein
LRRIERDAAGENLIFASMPLDRTVGELEGTQVNGVIEELYRRFLVRLPEARELSALQALADPRRNGQLPSRDLAHALCLAVGTQLEFLFY